MGGPSSETSFGVSADGLGNVYISGEFWGPLGGTGWEDTFVSKYDTNGNLAWTRHLATISHDVSKGVSADGLGNVFISGYTGGDLGGPSAGPFDAFVSKYNASGTLIWTRQIGTSEWDESHGVAADDLGNVFITGYTRGDLDGTNVGSRDVFVSKYDTNGNLTWTRQIGTSVDEIGYGVSTDGLGNVFITGSTWGDLSGTNLGFADAFIVKYDTNGNLIWSQQIGTPRPDISNGVSADGLGNVYISGSTDGVLDGSDTYSKDAFITKFIDLTFVTGLTGDYNSDGIVDAADYTIWRDSEGAIGAGFAADGNGDGFVNSVDYDLWMANFGETSAVSVPEPGSLLTTGLMLASLSGFRRKERI